MNSSGSLLIEHIRSFLHLTTQAPLEYVCKSALYLLRNVPATRPAVFEYIGTFYKVATFLHIRFSLNKKNASNRNGTGASSSDQSNAESNNINHINQVLDLIETSIGEILVAEAGKPIMLNNDLWSIELSQWLIDLIGDIISNNGVTFTDTPGLSLEESNQFKSLSIIEALEFWSNQCKPTSGILKLIRKCFITASVPCQLSLIDLIFNASSKYTSMFDWILCDLAALAPQMIFEKCLKIGYKEFAAFNNAADLSQANKLSRTNFINFYSLNFSGIVKSEIVAYLEEAQLDRYDTKTKRTMLFFLLKLSSTATALLNLLLNEILTDSSYCGSQCLEFLRFNLNNCDNPSDKNLLAAYLVEAIKQLNNSVAAYDLISSLIAWISSETSMINEQYSENVLIIIVGFVHFS